VSCEGSAAGGQVPHAGVAALPRAGLRVGGRGWLRRGARRPRAGGWDGRARGPRTVARRGHGWPRRGLRGPRTVARRGQERSHVGARGSRAGARTAASGAKAAVHRGARGAGEPRPRGPGSRATEARGPRRLRAGTAAQGRGGRDTRRKEGKGEEGEEREREREGGIGEGRSHLGDPNPAITVTKSPRAQRGRERGGGEGEEVAAWEKNQMREIERRGARAHCGGGGAPGAHGPRPGRARLGWVGLGHVAGRNPTARTTTDRNSNCGSKSKTRRGEHAIKHDIIQKKYASA
jgi:hypothetical protein